MRQLVPPFVLVGLSILAGLAHAQYQRTNVSELERVLRRRNTASLFRTADKTLAFSPDDADAQSLRGSAFSMLGWPTEAIVSFDLARGGSIYESDGQRYHAESLRDVGRGREAAELRKERRLVETPNHHAFVGIEANIVDDYRTAGAWSEALDAADDLLATAPANVIAHSTVAQLMYDLGDDDEAAFQLFLASRIGTRSYRYLEVVGQIAYDEGRYDAAAEALAVARKQRPKLPRVRALQLNARCDAGEAAEALVEVDYPRFRDHGHPDLLLAEMRCRLLNNQPDLARHLRDDVLSLFPGSPQANAAAAYYEAATASE
mgnify:CR=1 FL=1